MTRHEKQIVISALKSYAENSRMLACEVKQLDLNSSAKVAAQLNADASVAAGLVKVFSDILDKPAGSILI